VDVRATFTQANNLPATYARFQISTTNNFTNIVYDSGQVAIQPISDGQEGSMIFGWFPPSEGTYYYRLCFWDNANYTKTGWTVWNGTTVGETVQGTYNLVPVSDYLVQWDTVVPDTPTTHFDKVDEIPADDSSTYIQDSSGVKHVDLFRFSTPPAADDNFKRAEITLNLRLYSMLYGSNKAYFYFECNGAESAPQLPWSGFKTFSMQYTTNPATGLPWTFDDLRNVVAGIGANTVDTSEYLFCTQVYIAATYYDYTFSYTPTNEAITVRFPIFVKQEVINE
jgi:hypothetical protein